MIVLSGMHPSQHVESARPARVVAALGVLALVPVLGMTSWSCAGTPAASMERYDLGPVPVADLAEALVALGPYENFTMLVHPLTVPQQGHLECRWKEGRPPGVNFVDTGAPGGQWWRLPLPPNTVGFGEPQEDMIKVFAYIEDRRISDSLKNTTAAKANTYHAAFLCAHDNYAAFSVGYYCGALCGKGFRIVLRQENGHWKLADAQPTWSA